jgi:hypothetical protein
MINYCEVMLNYCEVQLSILNFQQMEFSSWFDSSAFLPEEIRNRRLEILQSSPVPETPLIPESLAPPNLSLTLIAISITIALLIIVSLLLYCLRRTRSEAYLLSLQVNPIREKVNHNLKM